MDYQIEIDRIIDALAADPSRPPKWRNKAIARLEEAQVFAMVEEADDPYPVLQPDGSIQTIVPGRSSIQFDGQELNTPALTINDIPPELRDHADHSQIKPDQP